MSDDYVIGAVIGEGLMGPRHTGRYRPSGHPVALEEVPPTLLDRPDFVERLAATARRAAAIRDPHVVPVYDLVRIGQRLYVVTELVRGRSLAALLGADRSLPLPDAMLVADSVLAGLSAIHAGGLAHGDVCPDTVVVTPAGGVRLTELGVTTVLAADAALPAWPAVEPPEGGGPSPAADLYGAGALLRELVTGLRPEAGEEWPHPDRVGLLVRRSVGADPAGRFPTAADFRQEVERTAAELFGMGWRNQGDLASRATRPLGPQMPRPRLGRSVTVPLPAPPEPDGIEPPPPPPDERVATGPTPPPPEPPEAAWSTGAAEGDATTAPAAPMAGIDPFDPDAGAPPFDAQQVARGPWGDGVSPTRRSQRRRGRRVGIAATVLVVVAAAAVAMVVALQPRAAAPATPGPLRVGDQVALTVQPSASGGCDTTFTFTATGELSGTGTLTYRWVTSTTGSTAVYDQYSVTITPNEGSFRFITPLQLTGPATLDGSVTFQMLSPQALSKTQPFSYTCAAH